MSSDHVSLLCLGREGGTYAQDEVVEGSHGEGANWIGEGFGSLPAGNGWRMEGGVEEQKKGKTGS